MCRSRRERDGEYERDFLEARIRSVPVIRSKQVSTVHRVQRNEHEGMIGGLVNASVKRKKKERGATRGLIYLSTGTISPWNAKDESNILVILCEYTIHHSLTTNFFRSCIRFRVKDRWSILIRSFDRSSIQSPTRFRVSFWKGKCKKKIAD